MILNRRVVITGMGALTPLGNDKDTFWASIRQGRCGIAPITLFDTSNHKAKLAAEVKVDGSDYLPAGEVRKMDRFTMHAVIAADEALRDSGITGENADPGRCGVIVASGIGGLGTIEREQMRGTEKGFDRVSPYFIPMSISNMAAGRISISSGFRGHSEAVVTACAGGVNAIGDAMRMIRHGYLDAVLCGGAEGCITPLAIGGFTSMKALSESGDPNRASIPFDLDRDGFVMGEGAGILMLEELEHARKRGAKIYAEVTGYAATCDAYHITAPDPTGQGGADAMRLAVEDAGLRSEDIGYINAHGTSTPLNDKGETLAVKKVFGDKAYGIPISSTKSMTGHLLGAAGAIEAIICAYAVKDGFIPATINYEKPDPDCDLDIVPNVGRSAPVKHAMSNSLGFGGHNASIIISRYDG
ncbi:MAG: beta-ketoacyl-ACP synthase II [Oscillospiraceae bacterium]|nr:beta-ketoacyl-ACP synthase II [Oscillospiraceae bacterium]